MVRGITDIVGTLSTVLPHWALGLLGITTLVVAAPLWVHNVRIKQIHGRTRRMVRASKADRERLFREVMDLAWDSPDRLLSVATNAKKYGLQDLHLHALDKLAATGALRAEVKKLRDALKRPPKLAQHPIEVVVNVRRLLEQDMVEAARQQVDKALRRFPKDADLLALRAELDARASADGS